MQKAKSTVLGQSMVVQFKQAYNLPSACGCIVIFRCFTRREVEWAEVDEPPHTDLLDAVLESPKPESQDAVIKPLHAKSLGAFLEPP